MPLLINFAIMAAGVSLLFGVARYWDRDRPFAISLIVTEVLLIAACLFLGPQWGV